MRDPLNLLAPQGTAEQLRGRRDFLKQAGAATIGSLAIGDWVSADTQPSAPVCPGKAVMVERIEAIKVVVPMKPGSIYTENFGPNLYDWSFDQVPKFILRIHTDTGLVGLGETRRGIDEQALAENMRFLKGRNLLDLDPAHPTLGLPQAESSAAFAIAYYDLLGKLLGVPVHVLLGGKLQDKVAVTYWTGQRTVSDLPNIAQRAVDLGFRHLKFKARQGDPVVEQTEAVRKVLPELALTVDFNESYQTVREFLPVGQALDEFHIMLEDPVPREIDSFRELREKLDSPIALTPKNQDQMFEAIKKEACDVFNLFGLNREFVQTAYLAELAGIPVWHGSEIELGIRDASLLHAAAATRSCTIPSDILCYMRESDLLEHPMQVVDGQVQVPQGHGLGVNLDEDKLKHYQIGTLG